ncbi:hypothetical protein GCM10022394_20560 [Zobellella aerophila]|uniref:Transposase n=1 Tax=Zobellella aerophila TaxID=870480 RepID=A0ABP6VUK1_9GAMM
MKTGYRYATDAAVKHRGNYRWKSSARSYTRTIVAADPESDTEIGIQLVCISVPLARRRGVRVKAGMVRLRMNLS